jgi:hypothetical protein
VGVFDTPGAYLVYASQDADQRTSSGGGSLKPKICSEELFKKL